MLTWSCQSKWRTKLHIWEEYFALTSFQGPKSIHLSEHMQKLSNLSWSHNKRQKFVGFKWTYICDLRCFLLMLSNSSKRHRLIPDLIRWFILDNTIADHCWVNKAQTMKRVRCEGLCYGNWHILFFRSFCILMNFFHLTQLRIFYYYIFLSYESKTALLGLQL